MQPLISLVIPVYNVEKYFAKCMESVLAQTYENFEVVLVDDGSTDASGKMCDEYAERDARIRVYHKSNEGPSMARNYAIEHSRGDYIAFLDSDDFVTEDYLDYLFSLLQKYNASISCGNYWRIKESNGFGWRNHDMTDEEEVVLSSDEAIQDMCYGKRLGTSQCVKLFQRGLFKNNAYPPDQVYGEDVFVVSRLISMSPRVAVGGRCIYWYVQRAGSSIHRGINENTLQPLKIAKDLLEFVKENHPDANGAAFVRCAMLLFEYMPQILESEDVDMAKRYFCEYRRFILTHIGGILQERAVQFSLQVKCCTIILGYWPTKILWILKKKLKGLYEGYDVRRSRALNHHLGGG